MATEVFTTSDGREIPLRPVSRVYVARIQQKHAIPKPPTYTAQLVGGGTQTFDHDETTLESTEDHRAWKEYQEARSEAIAGRIQDTMRFLFYHCVNMEPPPVEEWSVDFDAWGIDPPDPEDKIRFKQEWIEMELLADQDDYAKFTTKLYELAGLIDSKAAEEFERFFRLTLARLTSG